MQHTPLDTRSLGADAQRALSTAPAKMMAARGMAPIARPVDLAAVFYQLALDSDAIVRETATRGAGEIPEGILRAALADTATDARVLDFFSTRVRSRPALIEAIVLNRTSADETIAAIALNAEARLVDIIATNEERLLRHPEIIGAMYMNKLARMSTVDRAVELAVRNKVRVPGIPAWEEICKALLESGKRDTTPPADQASDAEFARVLADGIARDGQETRDEEAGDVDWNDRTIPEKIRLVTIGGSQQRSKGIRDAKLVVAMAAAKAPGVNENEARKWAGNHALARQVIAYIAGHREWTQHYDFKFLLVQNPKCPVTDAMKFVLHLREKDVRTVARSHGIPAPVVTQARKLLTQRAGGGGKK
jgi:hypothetical protein